MEEKTVKNSLKLMWQGFKMFIVCSIKAMAKATVASLADAGRGIVKHPILALLIVGVVGYQAYIIMTQRVERDQATMSTYQLEQKYDSAQIAADITQFRYEHRNDTTTRSKNAY